MNEALPPSRGHGTKRNVAPSLPDPDPVNDVDTEGEEQEEEGLSNTDANGNEEGDSSSTKKACVDINAVHKEYSEEEGGKRLELCLLPLPTCCP